MERQGPLPRSLVFISTQETDTGSSLREALLEEGFDVTWFPQSELFDATLQEATPDLAILDLSPNFCGSLESLRKLRELSSCPLLALSPNGGDAEIIAALEWADDYVLKPFSTRELLARVRALLRRLERQGAGSEIPRTKGLRHNCILCLEAGAHAFLHGPFTPRLLIAVIQSLVRCRERPSWAQPTALCFGGLRLEPGRSSLCFSGREVSLSMAELAIMTLLMSEPSRTFSREELIGTFNGYLARETRALDVHITHLRQKIAHLGTNFFPPYVVRGKGYTLQRDGMASERRPRGKPQGWQ